MTSTSTFLPIGHPQAGAGLDSSIGRWIVESRRGIIPIGLGLGETGSEIHAPLALVVLSGLFTSTALNMIVVPAFYWHFHRERE